MDLNGLIYLDLDFMFKPLSNSHMRPNPKMQCLLGRLETLQWDNREQYSTTNLPKLQVGYGPMQFWD